MKPEAPTYHREFHPRIRLIADNSLGMAGNGHNYLPKSFLYSNQPHPPATPPTTVRILHPNCYPQGENDHQILHTRPPTPPAAHQTSPNRANPRITRQPPANLPRLVAPPSRNHESPPGLPRRPRSGSRSPPHPPSRGTRMNRTREMIPTHE